MGRYIQSICFNCDPKQWKPGQVVKVTHPIDPRCPDCGRSMRRDLNMRQDYFQEKQRRWDTYFRSICLAVAAKSPCLSRKIGALLIKENVIVSTGFNGPARGYPHCQDECPRKVAGCKSGEGLYLCPATHAETNCIASAARIGASISGCTLYMNCIIPCKDCMNILVNAGVKEIVIDELTPYHEISIDIAKHAGVKIRRFVL